jgi:hypothetical protein
VFVKDLERIWEKGLLNQSINVRKSLLYYFKLSVLLVQRGGNQVTDRASSKKMRDEHPVATQYYAIATLMQRYAIGARDFSEHPSSYL